MDEEDESVCMLSGNYRNVVPQSNAEANAVEKIIRSPDMHN